MKNQNAWLVLISLAATAPIQAQTWSWPGCADITNSNIASNFKYTTLVRRGVAPDPNLAEPIKMAFDMDSAGNVDVYYIERGGQNAYGDVKRFQPATGAVKTLAVLPTWRGPWTADVPQIEEGLTGIALDPAFKTNHYMYLYYSPVSAPTFRLSRFTVNGDTLISEKVILDIPAQRAHCCHTGGSMAFDDYGDLWLTVGANTGGNTGYINETDSSLSEEWGSSSTHGLRGGIVRIHPDNSAKGYSIPSGNFGAYMAMQTRNNDYLDTTKVLPEIYVKGTRNAYSIALDPVRRWLMWGDVGPDGGAGVPFTGENTEEYDLVQHPGYMGWPYFAGDNIPTFGSNENPSAPTNTSRWNHGLNILPPATPAIYPYPQAAAITGPLYRYDGDLKSSVKFPPHFNRHWFVTDFDQNRISIIPIDSTGTTVNGAYQNIFTNLSLHNPLDLEAGPDGAFYVVNYSGFKTSDSNTSIVKISYTGTCQPSEPKLETPASAIYLNPAARYTTQTGGWLVNLGSNAPVLVPNNMVGFEVFDLMGRKIWETPRLRPGQNFNLPPTLPRGALKYRWLPAL